MIEKGMFNQRTHEEAMVRGLNLMQFKYRVQETQEAVQAVTQRRFI